jgi:phage shock protein E
MEAQLFVYLGIFIAFVTYSIWRKTKMKDQLPDLKKRGALVLDVRSPAEFSTGSVPGSVNIPVSDLPRRLGELDKGKPVIVCCASGMRASTAAALLKAQGFQEVVNAGPWQNAVC